MIYAFGGFLFLLFSGVPIVFALGVAALVTIATMTDVPLAIVAQRAYGGIHSFTLMAIPFFVTAGVIMEAGGIVLKHSENLIISTNKKIGVKIENIIKKNENGQ